MRLFQIEGSRRPWESAKTSMRSAWARWKMLYVGEAGHDGLWKVREDHGVRLGGVHNLIEDALAPNDEVDTQAGRAGLVVIKRLVEFPGCFVAQVEPEAHFSAIASARALTASHGMTASGREMLSARRPSSSRR